MHIERLQLPLRLVTFACLTAVAVPAQSSSAAAPQRNSPPPASTDQSQQASPVTPPPAAAPVVDTSVNASLATPIARGVSLRAGTTFQAKLLTPLTSATNRNADHARATLLTPVRTSAGTTLRAGTPVVLTMVSVAAAGTIESAGELTLQAIQVGNVATLSEFITTKGVEGHKDLADSAPAKGTEATLAAGTILHLKVAKIPL